MERQIKEDEVQRDRIQKEQQQLTRQLSSINESLSRKVNPVPLHGLGRLKRGVKSTCMLKRWDSLVEAKSEPKSHIADL